jgi:effector-binding domain-containing protein
MKEQKRLIFLLIFGVSAVMALPVYSYGKAFEKTPVDQVEIKTLPQATYLVTRGEGRYFEKADPLFMRLFRYIKKHDVAMTVPVEVEIDQAAMRFHVGTSDLPKELADEGEVHVETMPVRTVISIGARGSYNEKNFSRAEAALLAWLEENTRYRATGPAYAVYWNGPYVPGFFKRFEVHIPVTLAEDG